MKKRILVIRFGSLGDVLLTSAAVANLRISFPDHEITYLTKERFAPVVQRFGTVDKVLSISDPVSTTEFYRCLREFSKVRYEKVIDLHGNLRSIATRMMLKAGLKVSYPKRRGERWLMTRRTKKIPRHYPHTIDLYNSAVSSSGGSLFCRRPQLKMSSHEQISALLSGISHQGPIIAVAPGAAHPTKQWPIERFAEVATTLYRTRAASIIWIGTEHERAWPELKSLFEPERFVECINQPIAQLADVIAQANITVSNDSGLAHLSSAVGTPVVAVFGPTHQALGFAGRGLRDCVVEVDEHCRPCSRHGRTPCYRERRFCLERITPAMVSKQTANILDDSAGIGRACFVDRDGTVITDKHFLSDPDQIEFIDSSVQALKEVQGLGFKVVIISNQSGVARGLFDVVDVERMNARLVQMLAEQGVKVDAVYYCPHLADGKVDEYAISCNCRKPAPGMLEEAASQLGIDLRRSYAVGDKLDDLFLGFTTAVTPLLVRTGKGAKEEQRLSDFCFGDDIKVVDNLLAAVKSIEEDSRHA
ncbi:MAG: D-glycero-beta-D-manno-heptose 1,7-bisphosphate 7-phosphatase [candidate division Zixibacteria bacterium]|nr:D-glycero-beta-D-manno-heptose 1,7-bisphosphate 7-phosphatase [candidate division Zixibacteria bacterium]MDH3936351.1 D-glycero-beta-D-manno-heptose 1,7-bisphosphate 7-phosphatase [candidate division Zixibacteria bacterium]MDH4035453.1 D-glycero-beta-D-manno-heptose 1,7-bisphosphate 7-phosphatase [candidate division Zixibacteria bacterium]